MKTAILRLSAAALALALSGALACDGSAGCGGAQGDGSQYCGSGTRWNGTECVR